MENQNKLGIISVNRLIWTMGLPMILSMVLQAVYNVVDTIFVINSSATTQGNAALTAAFPVQIFIIAVGVGTGIGINAMLSRKLGEGDKPMVNKIAGNGILLALIIYGVFLLFGFFGSKMYMALMSTDNTVIEMGTQYLRICCCLSFGAVGFTVYERFLQATGRTVQTMAAQVSGAIANIVLDYIFVILMDGGVVGAAYATVIGQVLSLAVAAAFHYTQNKEISGSLKYIRPDTGIIRSIYKIGIPASIMQALLAVMMFMVLQIFNVIEDKNTMILMINTYGIYYKIMQTALMACFGMSNTLITIVSFNHDMNNTHRLKQTIVSGILDTIIVSALITLAFQLFAAPVSELFGISLPDISQDGILKSDILITCENAIHTATIGYIFMGISVAVQGILQGLYNVYKPIIISVLRLIIFVAPFALLFSLGDNIEANFWWTFVIADILTAAISIWMLKNKYVLLSHNSIPQKEFSLEQ